MANINTIVKLSDDILFWTISLWVKVNSFLNVFIGSRFFGVGYLLRRISSDRVFTCNDIKFYFNHKIAGCYSVMVGNIWNEPETHKFLKKIFTRLGGKVHFVDVGANIGEMIMDVARYPSCDKVTAFEPVLECAASCRESASLNGYDIDIRTKALSKDTGYAMFNLEIMNPNASKISNEPSSKSESVQTSTLDHEMMDLTGNTILLIDVEGSELDVVCGGRRFIQRVTPLIIFEYNDVTKKYFALNDMARELGSDYQIYRLRSNDGLLDEKLNETWNCVAVHKNSAFYSACKELLTA